MNLLPKDILEKLEFDKVLELLQDKCMGQSGREEVAKLKPRTEVFILDRILSEVVEYKLSIEEGKHIPIANYENVDEELKMLEIEGSVLPIEQIINIKNQLFIIKDIFYFFRNENQKIYPTIYDLIRPLSFDEKLVPQIERIIDEEGNIKPNASPELAKIRSAINSKRRELNKKFESTISQYKSKGWLTDNIESFRNGRRVLSVPAEHKRKIGGIIHDESSTGRTTFIEPAAIIDINNDIFDLENEERREIIRVLRNLCNLLRPYVPIFRKYQELLIQVDVIQAKAKLAVQMDAHKPKIEDQAQFEFLSSFHPLLLLKNNKIGKPTIPFDLVLHGNNRQMILSGPNAGGKSIAMKAVGLLQMMLQSGMLVPSDEESKYGIFHSFFADIGDQQSLEDDLSTYSSRLKNMKNFIQEANDRTLVLIDELGSGTDPQVGGALAEAILKALYDKKVFAFVTTHYSNLKVFAFKTKGIINAAMRFDKDSLSPTYELQVGKPGSSYGFEIANKIGLPKKVVQYAKHKVGKNERAVDQLLIDLQREKQELEEQLERAKKDQLQLDKLLKSYQQMSSDLEVNRKRLKLEKKEWEMQRSAREGKVFEKLVKQIKEEKNLEKAKKMAAQAKQKRLKNTEKVTELEEDLYYKEKQKQAKAIEVGDFVQLKTGGTTGKVVEINKNKVILEMGMIKMSVKLRDLKQVNEPLEIQREKRVKTDIETKTSQFNSKIDLRGMRREEALDILEKFMDNALVAGVSHIEILHGKGDGILRKAVHYKLKEYNIPMDISHPEREYGGDGVTIVKM